MPRRTNTDIIHDLEGAFRTLEERCRILLIEVDGLKQAQTRDQEARAAVHSRLAVVEARFEDSKKGLEESDRKRWAAWLALLGSFLMLLVNLVLTLLRK